jgi:hypothetical protein
MIYFGDGDTDIPCMRMVKQEGGYSVAVYNPEDEQKRLNAEKLIKEERVNFVCEADYRKEKDIFNVVKTVLEKMKSDFDFAELLNKHKKIAENTK